MPKARTGYQVRGSLFNDVPAFGGADYNSYIGTPDLKESKYITAVPRDKANLEAEGGETVFGDINGDGFPEHKIIKGPRHSQGGVPLNLPDDSFIYSDTKSMKIKDPNILAMFNKPMRKSGYTPAELAKSYDLEKYRKILQDPNSDQIDRKTAELMLRNYNVKLAQLALAQEAKKGFPQGIPKVAEPAMQAMGLKEDQILPVNLPAPMPPQDEMPEEGQESPEFQEQEPQGQEMAEQMNEGQPVAMPMEEEEMQPEEEQMVAYGGVPMAAYGMSMGGYDMPFYNMPMAARGMAKEPCPQGTHWDSELEECVPDAPIPLNPSREEIFNNPEYRDYLDKLEYKRDVQDYKDYRNQKIGEYREENYQGPMKQNETGEPYPDRDSPEWEQFYNSEDFRNLRDQLPNPEYTPGWQLPYNSPSNIEHYPQIGPWNKEDQYDYDEFFRPDTEGDPENYDERGKRVKKNKVIQKPGELKKMMDNRYNEWCPCSKKQEIIVQGRPTIQEICVPCEETPMAMYGMEMGGYDMPFDLPQAEYGMPMGVTSRNYMGREPMYARGGIPYEEAFELYKMNGGGEPPNSVVVKRSDFGTDAAGQKAYEKALRISTINAQKSGKKLYVLDTDGKYKQSSMKYADVEFTGDLAQFGNDKESANRYAAIEAAFQDPDAMKIFAKNTRDALRDKASYQNKYGQLTKSYGFINPGAGHTGYLGDIDKISDADIADAFKEHNKRNLMLQGHGYYASLYNDMDGKLRRKNSIGDGERDNKGFIETMMAMKKPDGTNYTREEAEAKYAHMSNPANKVNSLDATFKTIGAPEMVSLTKGNAALNKKALLQQATMHGYDRMVKAVKSGSLTAEEAASVMDFRGNLQAGFSDETGTGSGDLSRISPIEGIYTNTTAGHQGDAARVTFELGDEYLDKPCNCEDGTTPPRDEKGECPCKESSVKKEPCECTKEDGTKVTSYIDETTGECSDEPCKDPKRPTDIPAPWWLQDTIKTTAIAGDLMSLKKYMPWAPDPSLVKPRPVFLDPTRELAQQSEQANIQTQAMAQFAGPQALSARSSSVQGQAAKQAADTLSRYNNANVNIANQFEMKRTDIDNQETLMKQAAKQKLYDQNTIANQQFDNSKRAMRNALVNQYTNAITNRWQTHALNQMYPQFNVDASVGGRGFYTGNAKKITPGSGSQSYNDLLAYYKGQGMTDENAINAADKAWKNQAGSSGNNDMAAYNAHYGGRKKKKGGSTDHPGFLYGDVTYPFIL